MKPWKSIIVGVIAAVVSGISAVQAQSFPLPTDVESAVRMAALGSGEAITGLKLYDVNNSVYVIKVESLTFSIGGTMALRVDPLAPKPPFIVVAAKNVYIQRPQSSGDVATITYDLTRSTDAVRTRDGIDGKTGAGLGGSGGNGDPPPPSDYGKTYNLPPVYVLFQNISVLGGDPNLPELLRISFRGVPGGKGADGANGGRGGDGTRGSDASCGSDIGPCNAGPGQGHDSGAPGPGARGGDGANGGNGADIRFFGPSAAVATMGFFTAANDGGHPGIGGHGGICGTFGQPGGAGSRRCCKDQSGPGAVTPCATPHQASPGNTSTTMGKPGAFSLTPRD